MFERLAIVGTGAIGRKAARTVPSPRIWREAARASTKCDANRSVSCREM